MGMAVNEIRQDIPKKEAQLYKLRKLQAKDIPVLAKIIGSIGIDELISCYGDEDFTELLIRLKNRRKLLGEDDSAQLEPAEEDPESKPDNDKWVMGIAVAVRAANKIFQRMDRCASDIYSLLGEMSGLSAEEVESLDIDVFVQMVTDVITGNNFANFIEVAKKFMK